MACCPAAPTGKIPGQSAGPAPRSPTTTDAKPATPKAQIYRHAQCARCALRKDLAALIVDSAADPLAMGTIVDILCGADRPESILTWKRHPKVQALLTGLSSGDVELSHEGLDKAGHGQHISHLRSLLEHHGVLVPRDAHLALLETWLAFKLDAIPVSVVRALSGW